MRNGFTKPIFSVIIPTKNNASTIEHCLESIFSQDFHDFEVIIVDGHSGDNTVAVAKRYPVRIIFEDIGTPGGARNTGLQFAKGEIIVFTDADCEVPRDWLRKMACRFENDSSLLLLGGIDVDFENESSLGKTKGLIETFRRLESASGAQAALIIKTCNAAYKKEAFIKFDGFDASLKYGEETEFNARLFFGGAKILYDPDILVRHHRHERDIFSLRRVMKNTQHSVPILFRKHVAKIALKNVSSPVFTSYLLLAMSLLYALFLILGFFANLLWIVIGLELASLSVGVFIYTILVTKKTRRFPQSFLVPIVILFDTTYRILGLYLGVLKEVMLKIRL